MMGGCEGGAGSCFSRIIIGAGGGGVGGCKYLMLTCCLYTILWLFGRTIRIGSGSWLISFEAAKAAFCAAAVIIGGGVIRMILAPLTMPILLLLLNRRFFSNKIIINVNVMFLNKVFSSTRYYYVLCLTYYRLYSTNTRTICSYS